MHWNTYFLWAGIFLMGLTLIHYLMQRKLYDDRTKLLLVMMILVLGICSLATLVTYQRNHRLVVSTIDMIPVTLVYLLKLWLIYCLFKLANIMMRLHDAKLTRVVFATTILFTILIITNLVTGWISYPMDDGLIHVGKLYPVFVYIQILSYLLIVVLVLVKQRRLQKNHFYALIEMALLAIVGIFLQSICLVQLVAGFMLALGLSFLYQQCNGLHAYLDFTTQVFNRDYFDYWYYQCKLYHHPFDMIVLKLEDLDDIQNKLGSQKANKLIKDIGKQLWKLTPAHRVFRISGNSFIICGLKKELMTFLLDELKRFFNDGINIDGRQISCLVKMGLFLNSNKIDDANELQAYIDFLFKYDNQNSKVVIIEDNKKTYQRYLYEKEVSAFLETAIKQDLLEVYYQPIYSLHNQKYVSLEALSRLKHPQLGYVDPELFISLAMEKGLLFQIMQMQVDKVCQFIKNYPKQLKDINNIKINLSSVELEKEEYLDRLLAIIKDNNVSFDYFAFEVSEAVALNYSYNVAGCLHKLKALGIELGMDDFGTGYSNLSLIKHIPFSIIKIDRSLLVDIITDKKAARLYQGIIELLKNLDYVIICEGVETAAELAVLQKWKVDMIQGFYYSPPLPAKQIIKHLSLN